MIDVDTPNGPGVAVAKVFENGETWIIVRHLKTDMKFIPETPDNLQPWRLKYGLQELYFRYKEGTIHERSMSDLP